MLVYIIYISLGTLSNFLTTNIWINLIIHITLSLTICANFTNPVKSKITFALCYTTAILISEIFVGIVYVSILKSSLNTVVIDDTSRIVASIIQTLLLLIGVKSIEYYKNSSIIADKVTTIDSLFVGLIPLCSIVMLYIFAKMSLLFEIPNQAVIVSCTLIILINIFFFGLFDKLRLSEKLKYENAILKTQMQYYAMIEDNTKTSFEKIRKIKHNLKYQLLYLKSKTEENSQNALGEIKRALNDLIEETLEEETILYTKNKDINRLLNYKLYFVHEHNIPVDIKVIMREDVSIDGATIYTIIGNAIDNAIRNYDSNQSELKNIRIRIIDDCDNLYIKISNPYSKSLKFKNGLPITDKNNSQLHGIGLKSIKELVARSNGYFKISTENQVFTIEILMYDEIKHK